MLLVATSLALIAADRQDPAIFNAARRSTITVTEPVRTGLDQVSGSAAGAWQGMQGLEAWEEENDRLRRELAELEGRQERLPDTEAELERLLAATDIDYVSELERVTARVIVDRASPLGHVIEVNRGTDDGVHPGMPVVTGHGLVGIVEVAGTDRSVIQPITAADVHLGVRSGADYGVAAGTWPDSDLQLTLDPRRGDEPEVGQRYVTSGLDRSLYPDNVPVGEIVHSEAGEPVLVPLVDFDRLGYVTVLLWMSP